MLWKSPFLKLQRMPGPRFGSVFMKIEGASPTGSTKDRLALEMIGELADNDADQTARRMAREEGIFGGQPRARTSGRHFGSGSPSVRAATS